MKGHKRWRSGAWRLAVFAGVDAETGKQRHVKDDKVRAAVRTFEGGKVTALYESDAARAYA